MARAAGMANPMGVDPRNLSYANSNIQEITIRQLNEDLNAYKYDLDYCNNQLNDQSNMTPQETRTLQLRILDLGHQMRHCHHRIEILRHEIGPANGNVGNAQMNRPQFSAVPNMAGAGMMDQSQGRAPASNASTPANRRATKATPAKRPRQEAPTPYDNNAAAMKRARVSNDDVGDGQSQINTIQRLGFWKCRLCASEKYLTAGEGRQPSGPCKWPLKDVAKMIAHFTELHNEHAPRERCMELGDALDRNRGPFEYWLRRSHSMNDVDESVVDDCIVTLQSGNLPPILRRLSRAAAGFPDTH